MLFNEKFKNAISVIANIAVIFGILIAYIEYNKKDENQRQSVAIEALKPIMTYQFVIELNNIIKEVNAGHFELSSEHNKSQISDRINYIMSSYNYIACLYNNNLADRKIIQDNIKPAINNLPTVLDKIGYPKILRNNFDIMLSKIVREK
jgi:hypothetical protein